MPAQRSGGSQVSPARKPSRSPRLLTVRSHVDRESLEWCGPDFGPRANESEPLDNSGAKPAPLPPGEDEVEPEAGGGVVRRWLQDGEAGEAGATCYSCPASDSTECSVTRVYEPGQRVISQCVIREEETAWLVSYFFFLFTRDAFFFFFWARGFQVLTASLLTVVYYQLVLRRGWRSCGSAF